MLLFVILTGRLLADEAWYSGKGNHTSEEIIISEDRQCVETQCYDLKRCILPPYA